jgi:hypothetical protein
MRAPESDLPAPAAPLGSGFLGGRFVGMMGASVQADSPAGPKGPGSSRKAPYPLGKGPCHPPFRHNAHKHTGARPPLKIPAKVATDESQ